MSKLIEANRACEAIQNLTIDEVDSIGGGVSSDAMYGAAVALVLGGAATGQPEIVAAGVVAGGIALFLDRYAVKAC